jgi:FkbM family methyltransferase
MTAAVPDGSSRRAQPARSRRNRLARCVRAFQVGWECGDSITDRFRLFYHAELKPSLVFRGWTRYQPERMLTFSIKAAGLTRFRAYVRDNGAEAPLLADFFSLKRRMMPPNLPPLRPRVIYDLGANIGMASLGFAALYPEARVYGFEPLPSNFEVCRLNYQNLPKARLFPWAVGARTERTSFEHNEDPQGGHLHTVQGNPALHAQGHIQVQVYSIADLVREQKLDPPEFLKIDVEGAELEVLRGIGDAVQSIKRIFVETHGETLKAGCLAWLGEHGFQITPSSNPAALWADRT